MFCYNERMLPSASRGVRCAVLSITESRTPETDESGRLVRQRLADQGHIVSDYRLLRDDATELRSHLLRLAEERSVQVAIITGGTSLAPRDQAFEAVVALLERRIEGFGELFRYLAFKHLGASAILMRAAAGLYRGLAILALPGSPACVSLALEKLILPELTQLAMLARTGVDTHRSGVH